MATEHPTYCNPNDFYGSTTSFPAAIVELHRSLVIVLTVVVMGFSPLLIVSPFVVPNLNTATRKMMAMIAVADEIQCITFLALVLKITQWGSTDDGGFGCRLVTFLHTASIRASVTWALFLLLAVFFVFVKKPKLLDMSRKRGFTFMNITAWGSGLVTIAIPYVMFDIQYSSDYITGSGCDLDLIFYLKNNGTQCLPSLKGSIWLVCDYYIILFATFFLAIAIFCYNVKELRSRENLISHAEELYSIWCKKTLPDILTPAVMKDLRFYALRISIGGLINVIYFLPVSTRAVISSFEGPSHWSYLNIGAEIMMYIAPTVKALNNVVNFGLCSSDFRRELRVAIVTKYRDWRSGRKDLQSHYSIIPDNSTTDQVKSIDLYSSLSE